ncbi:U6 snRNA-associated Sm-like protein LSm1 [Paramacrobiotus metropolitanus]|uniref:U6 snRNA-associated Sm-like protein LSm1 n=1 Tax=Paramacrobiotus metropolitanus TaxID=2943436 RepID=UPI0024457C2E|nr:U6 snRNA-associated Sm-like protein LSm1 [Paramacrobiotus metropolitanus]
MSAPPARGRPCRGPPNVNVLPGTAHLCYELDKKLLVWLRDGRTFLGCLKSVDQFGNLVLSDTIERIYVGLEYGDIQRGIFILRGENVILVGEWDAERERAAGTRCCEIGYILAKQAAEEEQRHQQRAALKKALRQRGLSALNDESGLGDDHF